MILLTLATIALTACNGEETSAENGGKVALQVTGGIQTRAADNQWQANDAIGIYMLKAGSTDISESAKNRKYTTSDGGSAFIASSGQTIYFPVDGSKVEFIAYYPYQTLDNGTLMVNVSNQGDLSLFDLMTASTKSTDNAPLDKNHPQVAFDFSHRLTKIELNISAGNGLSSADLKGIKVEITHQRTNGSYDPQYDVQGVNATPVQTIMMNTNEAGTSSQAILLPNTAADGINPVISGRELLFTLAATGEVFRWTIPDTKLFQAGERNIYNITINRTSINVTATITNWNNGNGTSGENQSAQ